MIMSATEQVELSNFSTIFSLEGKVAVVPGGSRGLGLQAASGLYYALSQYSLTAPCNTPVCCKSAATKMYITSRRENACDEAIAALNVLPHKRPGAQAISMPADISCIEELDRLAPEIRKTTDHIDILFANAGATRGEKFDTHAEKMFSKVMDLNENSVFYTMQKLAPLLVAKATINDPSRVIITASVATIGIGTIGEHATPSYSTSKAAAIHLAKNLAVELGPRHILTSAIAPRFYPSKITSSLIEIKDGLKYLEKYSSNGRLGRPEDLAGLVVFLSSRA